MVVELNHEEIWKGHNEKMNAKPTKEQLDMIKFVGTGYKLYNGEIVHYIGGVYDLNGDFFWMSNTGEVRLLLDFSIFKKGIRRRIKIRRFMLIDLGTEGLLEDKNKTQGITSWRKKNSCYKLVGGFYENYRC